MMPTEVLHVGRWAHPRGGRLHWLRAGQAVALCGVRCAPGDAWIGAGRVDLLRTCPDCDAALRAFLADALDVRMVVPGGAGDGGNPLVTGGYTMDASTYQTEAARTLIASADVPEFLPSNVAAAWGLVELARGLGLEIDAVKKAVFHQHGYSAPAQYRTFSTLCRIAVQAGQLSEFLDGTTAQPDQVMAARRLRAFDVRLLWNTMGVLGEGAEIAHLVLTQLESGDFDKAALGKEIGDLCWYLAALCTMADLDFGTVLAANIAKLKARYPEGWDAVRSQTRADAQEAMPM